MQDSPNSFRAPRQEIDDFQRMLELDAVLAERAGDGEARNHPRHPVETAPDGTESLCDPTTIAGCEGFVPLSRPMRLPAASTWVVRPVACMRSLSQARPSSNRGENERRV